MLVTAASWDDLRLDAADPCVVMVASDMISLVWWDDLDVERFYAEADAMVMVEQ